MTDLNEYPGSTAVDYDATAEAGEASGFTAGQAIVLAILVVLNLLVLAVGVMAFLGYLTL